jgi:hypothetical protein
MSCFSTPINQRLKSHCGGCVVAISWSQNSGKCCCCRIRKQNEKYRAYHLFKETIYDIDYCKKCFFVMTQQPSREFFTTRNEANEALVRKLLGVYDEN